MIPIHRFVNNLNMWKKLSVSTLLILMIPLFVATYLAFSLQRIVFENAELQARQSAVRVKTRIEQILSATAYISESIHSSAGLESLLFADYANDFERVTRYWDKGYYNDQLSAYNYEIEDIHFYIEPGYPVLNTGFIRNVPTQIAQTQWYERATQKNAKPFWCYVPNDSFQKRNSHNIALVRGLTVNGRIVGALSLYVNMDSIRDIMRQENMDVLLCTEQGRIMMSRDRDQIGMTLQEIHIELKDHALQQVNYAGEPSQLIMIRAGAEHTEGAFLVLSLFSIGVLKAQTRGIIITEYMLLVVGAVLSVILILVMSRLLARRLSQVGENIRRAASGDFDFTPRIDGRDEIGRLASDLNQMLISIRKLISEVYEEKLKRSQLENRQKDIQLQALNSQINPHFLFNCLEGIRMRATVSGDEAGANAVARLSNLLRRSLDMGAKPIPLQCELDLVYDYLDLQKFRFSHSFDYSVETLADIEDQTILPFTIQPIVENAVKHGMKKAADGQYRGYVALYVEPYGDETLLIRVADSGEGMTAEALASVNESLSCESEEPPTEHVGIANVHRRLRLNYGNAYGLTIASHPGQGTMVTIRIPHQGARGGYGHVQSHHH